MSESAKLQDWAPEQAASDPMIMAAGASRRALDFMLGLQNLALEEMVFVSNEVLERARTETHLFAEFVSKLAASHSVKDWRTMCGECSQHQLDFIRRDCDRLFRQGDRMVQAASSLLTDRSRG